MKPIKLHFSEKLIRKAVMAYWLRTTGWRFFTSLFLLLASLGYLLAIGDRSWFVGVLGAGLGFGLIVAGALYVTHYRASLQRFRRMRNPEGTLEPGESNFRITSDVGMSDIAWTSIIEVWRFPEFWLLFLSRRQFITLPIADLDSEAQGLLLDRFRSHGIKLDN
jgi:hypothetical protein